MKIVALIAQSVNGRITKGFEPNVYRWTSSEDKELLKKAVHNSQLIVMGSTTYLEAKRNITLNEKILRIILTSKPDFFKKERVDGQLEFYNYSPRQIVSTYKKKYKELLLLGGNKVYSDFLKEGLIDEFILTVEPCMFGKGIQLINEDVYADLKLISVKQLNKKGTLLLKYKVV